MNSYAPLKPEHVDAASARAWLAERKPALLLGNEWIGTETMQSATSYDPSTGEAVADFAVASAEDAHAAIALAKAAQPAWAALSVVERAMHLERFAAVLEANAELIALTDSIDAGLPVARMHGDVAGAARALRGWRGFASSLRGEVLPDSEVLHYTRHRPYGVVVKIVAYNHPFLFAVKGSSAALIAGNSVIVKPADQTPLSTLLIAELARDVLPSGVFTLLPGNAATGDALVTHPDVRRIGFTGSPAVGRLIQKRASESGEVKSVSLELGGKNAMVVLPDADVDRAAHEVVKAMNLRANAGQSCGSTSRLFLHEDVHDHFIERVRAHLEGLTLGPAYDRAFDMGPVITEAHAERVRGFIQRAGDAGAELVTGGLDDARLPERGSFVAPTLFAGVGLDTELAQEEVFGPVIAAFRWNDTEEMVRAVNDVEYGLTASIWTENIRSGLTLADRMETGYVWVNDSTTHYWGTPFGGWKNSGVGREESLEELLSYLQTTAVHVRLKDA